MFCFFFFSLDEGFINGLGDFQCFSYLLLGVLILLLKPILEFPVCLPVVSDVFRSCAAFVDCLFINILIILYLIDYLYLDREIDIEPVDCILLSFTSL